VGTDQCVLAVEIPRGDTLFTDALAEALQMAGEPALRGHGIALSGI
jgi:hypothetical protein